jgi:hypothetical protein
MDMTERNNVEIIRTYWFLGCWNPENPLEVFAWQE